MLRFHEQRDVRLYHRRPRGPAQGGLPLRHHEHATKTAPSMNLRRSPKSPRAPTRRWASTSSSGACCAHFLEADEADRDERERLRQKYHPRHAGRGPQALRLPLRWLLEGRRHDLEPVGGQYGSAWQASGLRHLRDRRSQDLRQKPGHAVELHLPDPRRSGRASSPRAATSRVRSTIPSSPPAAPSARARRSPTASSCRTS